MDGLRIKITNLDNFEYFEIIRDWPSSKGHGVIEKVLDFEFSITVKFNNLQEVVSLVKFLSEVYDNPEFEAL